MSQGFFIFGPIQTQLSASITVGLGINPSATTVSLPYMPAFPSRVGTAQWWIGGTLARAFPNSVLEKVRVSSGERGTTFQFTILDRRWMWGQNFGQITGEYNVRAGSESTPLRPKTARELAALCLNAMGENLFDVSFLPSNDYPYVDWEIANPAKALADLCDLYGCAVSLSLNDTVRIVRLGEGLPMPGGYLDFNTLIEAANLPKRYAVVSAPTEWQVDLELEAVGLEPETDKFVPINDLSYTPAEGWLTSSMEETEFDKIENLEHRKLALEHVFRTFRAKKPPVALQGAVVQLTERSQILPLISQQIETTEVDGKVKRKPAIVYGRFVPDLIEGTIGLDEAPTPGQTVTDEITCKRSFSIDEDQGLVQFSEPILGEGAGKAKALPDLVLRCTVNLYDVQTRQVQRYKVERDVDLSSPAGTAFDLRDDIVPQYTYGTTGSWENNLSDVQQQTGFYVDQAIRSYLSYPGAEASYGFFVQVAPDGAIRQVTYNIDQGGKATTRLSRNTEREFESPSYREARDRQRIAGLFRKQKRDERQQRQERKQARRADQPARIQ